MRTELISWSKWNDIPSKNIPQWKELFLDS